MAKSTTKATANKTVQKNEISAYDVQRAGWIHGRHYDKGEAVNLTERQAAPFLREATIKKSKNQNGGN